jgi:hypothetical protein
MFGPKTKVEHINFKYDSGVCIIKYMNCDFHHAIDICLWEIEDGPRQITINNFYAKNFYNKMQLKENQNLSSLEKLIKTYFIT